MGANRLNAVIDALASTVWKPKAPLVPPWQVTVGIFVDVASWMHVWPSMLPQV